MGQRENVTVWGEGRKDSALHLFLASTAPCPHICYPLPVKETENDFMFFHMTLLTLSSLWNRLLFASA